MLVEVAEQHVDGGDIDSLVLSPERTCKSKVRIKGIPSGASYILRAAIA